MPLRLELRVMKHPDRLMELWLYIVMQSERVNGCNREQKKGLPDGSPTCRAVAIAVVTRWRATRYPPIRDSPGRWR